MTAMRHFIASARFAAASAFVKLFDLPLLGDLPRTSLVDSPEDVLCRVRRARTLPCACVKCCARLPCATLCAAWETLWPASCAACETRCPASWAA